MKDFPGFVPDFKNPYFEHKQRKDAVLNHLLVMPVAVLVKVAARVISALSSGNLPQHAIEGKMFAFMAADVAKVYNKYGTIIPMPLALEKKLPNFYNLMTKNHFHIDDIEGKKATSNVPTLLAILNYWYAIGLFKRVFEKSPDNWISFGTTAESIKYVLENEGGEWIGYTQGSEKSMGGGLMLRFYGRNGKCDDIERLRTEWSSMMAESARKLSHVSSDLANALAEGAVTFSELVEIIVEGDTSRFFSSDMDASLQHFDTDSHLVTPFTKKMFDYVNGVVEYNQAKREAVMSLLGLPVVEPQGGPSPNPSSNNE